MGAVVLAAGVAYELLSLIAILNKGGHPTTSAKQ
jgi:hypothetical protein